MRAGSSAVEHRPLGWASRSLKREREQLIISGYTQVGPDKVALRLNQRPRKTLGFQTSATRLQEGVASTG
jgi:IS30 family transposase